MPRAQPGFREFVALMALMMSLVALAIDAMLPALTEIGRDLGVSRDNDSQLIISLLFLGMAAGQLIYGPLSDGIGRRRAIFVGCVIFSAGCVLSWLATSFSTMLAGRFLQGLGSAGPRIVCVALIRDRYSGDEMARVMSFVMSLFVLVPVLAPALGQGLMMIADWRAIFAACLLLGLVSTAWFAVRQPETLAPEARIPFSPRNLWRGAREVVGTRVSFGYAIATGLVFAAFIGYLTSVQQLLQIAYATGTRFPLYFGILAAAVGAASLANASLVGRFGMRQLVLGALVMISVVSLVFILPVVHYGGSPPLGMLMTYFFVTFFAIGILFGNLNALAMEPLGHIAGIGAAVIGSFATLISVPLGTAIGQAYDGTPMPVVVAFALFGTAAAVVSRWGEAGRIPGS